MGLTSVRVIRGLGHACPREKMAQETSGPCRRSLRARLLRFQRCRQLWTALGENIG